MTWVASPLFNFLLRFNKFGRLALTAEEKRESSWIGGFTLIALAFTVAHFATGASIGRPFFGMRIFGFMLFPIRVTYMVSAGRPRQIAATIAIGLFLLNVPFLSILCLDNLSPFRNPTQAANLFLYGQIGMIASSWLPMILRTRDSFR
jgi:hypothetical protein